MSRPKIAPAPRAILAAILLFAGLSGCSSVSFERDTATSGTFESTGWAFTIVSLDLPRSAMQMARENASDAGLENLKVEHASVSPDWGWWNWVLDIISVRKARLRGTWGFSGEN